MKRPIVILFLILFFTTGMQSNGGPPSATLNEIKFDSLGNWIIELSYYQPTEIDSIWIESSSGGSFIDYYTLITQYDLALIGDSNLNYPITINPAGDRIKTISYGQGYWHADSIIFGNYPGAWLDCTNEGESFAYVYQSPPGYASSFAIDRSPSIGLPNDNSGAMATFSGMVYDPEGEVFTEGEFPFALSSLKIHINPDGSFSEQIFARRYSCNEITIYFPPYPYNFVEYNIVPLEFSLRPDSSHQADFVTTGYVKIEERKKNYNQALIVSPNPFSSSITFYLDTEIFSEKGSNQLLISDLHGQNVLVAQLRPGMQFYKWTPDNQLYSGLFIYYLVNNNRILTSGRIIKI